jgi:hypothetical protein
VAIELARAIQRANGKPMCIVGADPTDRDVERWLPSVLARTPASAQRHVRVGHQELRAVVLAEQKLSIVTLSDRSVLEKVMPELQATFPFVIVDGPSSVGTGVGIAPALWPMLDILLVVSGLRAGDLATTTAYVNSMTSRPSARHIAVRVVTTGTREDSGLAPEQIDRKLRALSVIAALSSRAKHSPDAQVLDDDVDRALDRVASWIIGRADEAKDAPPQPEQGQGTNMARAARRYVT